MNKKKERLGAINYNTDHELMAVIEYNNANDITVEFENHGYIARHKQWKHFKKGHIRNPYTRSVCNVGYIGAGNYKAKENEKRESSYRTWLNMINRCYNKNTQKRQPTYTGCEVCEEWHNFQNFAEWFNENFYQIDNETMNLDKDLLIKGNKLYSPSTCCFIPKSINMLFRSNKKGNDSEYKEHKKILIKISANNYKGKIPDKIYETMIRYTDDRED